MQDIRLTNSATGAKAPFVPLDPSRVGLYVCGPTVYDRAHLGNARTMLVFDLLVRLLRHVYGAGHVRYVRNITDVDDKINARAAETGQPIGTVTAETTAWFHADMAALGVLPPDVEPRATGHIAGMVAMIEALIARGHAYAAEGHVLFDVRSDPGYGSLAHRSVDEMLAGARVEVAAWKRDPMDFVLWKPSEPGRPGWESPFGRGRPGWHIECSAMAAEYLGPTFDIHGGGLDLKFPHHENERAQSLGAAPDSGFARVWMHVEMLLADGRKMSKSLGNFRTVRDVLDAGLPGEVVRFALMGTHYARPMDWTEARTREAEAALRAWYALTEGVAASEPDPAFVAALADDLNVAGAIAVLHRLAGEGRAAALAGSAAVLGLLGDGAWTRAGDTAAVERLVAARIAARRARDFAEADRLRDLLAGAGVVLMDRGDGTDWTLAPGADLAALEP